MTPLPRIAAAIEAERGRWTSRDYTGGLFDVLRTGDAGLLALVSEGASQAEYTQLVSLACARAAVEALNAGVQFQSDSNSRAVSDWLDAILAEP